MAGGRPLGDRRGAGDSPVGKFLIRWHPLLIPAGVLLFYLPFIPRAFMGDDWLWLAHADKALADPALLLSRPIYGYFRPLYMLYIGVLQQAFGRHAFAFALTNLSLHLLNCYLLIRLLARLGLSHAITVSAAIFFGFYFLTCPAVCWISAGSDLLALTLVLPFIMQLITYYDTPSAKRLLLIIATGLAAALVKETGFICVLLFFLHPLLRQRNPLGAGYAVGGAVMIVLSVGFLGWYFGTRSFIDKGLVFNLEIITNLWYLAGYQLLPLSQRLVEGSGGGVRPLLTLVKAVITLVLPVVWVWLFIKKDAAVRLFLLWPLLFLGPVALFDWNVGLFDLYPQRTASRYMYIAIPGTAVLVAVMVSHLYYRLKHWRPFAVVGLLLFLAGNAAAVYTVTRTYRARQAESTGLYGQISQHRDWLTGCTHVIIAAESASESPTLFGYPRVLESICYLITGRDIAVTVLADPSGDRSGAPDPCVLVWVGAENRFQPSETANP